MKKPINKLFVAIAITLLSGCVSTSDSLKKKADSGDVKSQLQLGTNYYYGTKGIPKDKELSIKYLTLASNNDNAEASFNLGRIFEKEKKYDQSVMYYERAVKANSSKAMDNLANMYLHGRGVTKDLKKAEQLYLSALENGSKHSKRNLAVLYKEDKQYEKSIQMFKDLAFSPESTVNSLQFKKLIGLELMDMYYQQGNFQEAYLWGATAILAGVFDNKIANGKIRLDIFETIVDNLDAESLKQSSQKILENHYKAFQQYQPYILSNPEFKFQDGIIILSVGKLARSTGYLLTKNMETVQKINFLETKSDEISQINLAVNKLRLAASYIELGAIVPIFGIAQTQINEALDILNQIDNPNLDFLKSNIGNKLNILDHVYKYQEQQHDLQIKSNKGNAD